jgi:hypothetical protein
VEIDIIRKRVQAGNYLVRGHVVQHALKEGFERQHLVQSALNGTIIEEYPDEQRVLICGQVTLRETSRVYVHVVCEYADAVYVELITAYIPDEVEWENPPLRRRRKKG